MVYHLFAYHSTGDCFFCVLSTPNPFEILSPCTLRGLYRVYYMSMLFFFSRKKDVSCESDLKDAVDVSLPLIHAALRDIEKGAFPKNCFLNIEIPSSPLTNKVCFSNCYVLDWRKSGNALLFREFLLVRIVYLN